MIRSALLFLLLVCAVAAVSAQSKPDHSDPNEFILVDQEARPINLNQVAGCIVYPQAAKDAGITGRVVLRVMVSKKGKYVRHIVTKNPHPWLTDACERCISKLKFTPAIQNGKRIAMWVNVPFNFTLNTE
jgi:protein TonB